MLLKGVSDGYKHFSTVIAQNKSNAKLSDFKQAIKRGEVTESWNNVCSNFLTVMQTICYEG